MKVQVCLENIIADQAKQWLEDLAKRRLALKARQIGGRCYWYRHVGTERTSNTSTKTIKIPMDQVFDKGVVDDFFSLINDGDFS